MTKSRVRVTPVAVEVAGKRALGFPERAGSKADLTSGPITSPHLGATVLRRRRV